MNLSGTAILDLSILVLYLIGLTAYGIWAGRTHRNSQEGYFLGGRSLTWVLYHASRCSRWFTPVS